VLLVVGVTIEEGMLASLWCVRMKGLCDVHESSILGWGVLHMDGSFTRGREYPRIPDPTGKGTGAKIRPRTQIRTAKSTRVQLMGGNFHPRRYPLPVKIQSPCKHKAQAH
jgi:hypothetical protein